MKTPGNTCQYNVMMNNSSLDFHPKMTYTANTTGNKNKWQTATEKLSGKKEKGANYARHTGIKTGPPCCQRSPCVFCHTASSWWCGLIGVLYNQLQSLTVNHVAAQHLDQPRHHGGMDWLGFCTTTCTIQLSPNTLIILIYHGYKAWQTQ